MHRLYQRLGGRGLLFKALDVNQLGLIALETGEEDWPPENSNGRLVGQL